MKKLTLSLLLFSLLFTACAAPSTPLPAGVSSPTASPSAVSSISTVTAEGKLLPAAAVELAFMQSGRIAKVLVNPGSKLAAGDAIARLTGIETVEAELAAAQLEKILAQQAYDDMARDALLTLSQAKKAWFEAQKNYEKESARWNLGDAEKATSLELALDDYVQTEKDYQAAKTVLDQNADKNKDNSKRQKTQETFDQEKESLVEAYADVMAEMPVGDERLNEKNVDLLQSIAVLELARQQVERLERGVDRDQAAAAKSRLTAASAKMNAAKALLEFYELRSPNITTLISHDLSVGETAVPGIAVAYLGDPTRWIVETKDLAEIDIAKIALGQTAVIKLDAFPGEVFNGSVTAINSIGKEYLGDMTYMVSITLDKADPRFMWNMTATVTINIR